jgi:hypothetical protein
VEIGDDLWGLGPGRRHGEVQRAFDLGCQSQKDIGQDIDLRKAKYIELFQQLNRPHILLCASPWSLPFSVAKTASLDTISSMSTMLLAFLCISAIVHNAGLTLICRIK